MGGMFTSREEVAAVYKKRARHYDFTANLYYLLGFREWAYRRKAVDALQLRIGDTVVEIGCGTGLNFELLQRKVGPKGRIIGVDLSDAMLEKARARIEENDWSNVVLVESAAAAYRFPKKVDGIVSTFALTLEPDYDKVIARSAKSLKAGRRFVLLDIKLPDNFLRFLAPLLLQLGKPFAVSKEVAERHPWKSMERYLKAFSMEQYFFGIAYIATGEASRTTDT